jgi:hypothetical protein
MIASLPMDAIALEFDFTSLVGFTPQAEAALLRAAESWTSVINDPITVNIQTQFMQLQNPSVIGTAGSVTLVTNAAFSDNVLDMLRLEAALENDDAIVAFLPSIDNLNIALPTDFNFLGELSGTKANFKSFVPGIDFDGAAFGVTDAVINFNLGFSFDFDNANGVQAGHMDFETVAAHELGHALGFTSSVDQVDFLLSQATAGTIAPTILDLFRFGPGDNPIDAASFTSATRNLIPGVNAFFDDTDNEYLLSTGLSGDERQASHWKDINSIGILDPTLAFGQVFEISPADLRALDLIGYDISAVPLPAPLLLLTIAIALLLRQSRRSGLKGKM